MDRGSVVWIRHHYRDASTSAFPLVADDHPAVCLLPTTFASALQYQLLFPGTRGSAKPVQGATRVAADDRPLERHHPWHYADSPAASLPQRWKPFNLLLSSKLNQDSARGALAPRWEECVSPAFNRLVSDEAGALTELSQSRHVRRHGINGLVDRIGAGDLLRYQGRTLCVLSNAAVHRLHPFGVLIGCPVIPQSRLRSIAGAFPLGDARIAFEYVQTLEPFDDEPLAVLDDLPPVPSEKLALLQRAVLTYLGGTAPFGLTESAFLSYLHASSQEFREARISERLTSTPEAAGFGPRRVHRETRRLPPTGRAFSGGTAIGGSDRFRLNIASSRFEYWIERAGDKLSLLVSPPPGAQYRIEDLLLTSSQEGESLRRIPPHSRSHLGTCTFVLGPVRPRTQSLFRLCVVDSWCNLEEFDLELTWT